MSRPVTLENCNGVCCRDVRQWGICAHGYRCQHHLDQQAREDERQAWRDFVNGLTTAPGITRKRNR